MQIDLAPGLDLIGEPVGGTVEFYRDGGHWCILLLAPNWLLKDLASDMNAKGGVITQGNRGGGSMLLIAASWDARRVPENERSRATREESVDAD